MVGFGADVSLAFPQTPPFEDPKILPRAIFRRAACTKNTHTHKNKNTTKITKTTTTKTKTTTTTTPTTTACNVEQVGLRPSTWWGGLEIVGTHKQVDGDRCRGVVDVVVASSALFCRRRCCLR